MAREAEDILALAVHDAWCLTDEGSPLFSPDVTAGVVYIVRNPLDVAVSCARHWGVALDQSVANLCDPGFALSASLGRPADQLRRRLHSWTGHAASWLDESGLPVHLVRHEDLLLDPWTILTGVVQFLGLRLKEAWVKQAVALSGFAELQEQDGDFREPALPGAGPPLRQGGAGGRREELPDDLVQLLIQTHGHAMRRFGYLEKG
jgi:hypothetical protein